MSPSAALKERLRRTTKKIHLPGAVEPKGRYELAEPAAQACVLNATRCQGECLSGCIQYLSSVDGPRNYRAQKGIIGDTTPTSHYSIMFGCKAIVVDTRPSGHDVSIACVLRKTWLSASF